MAKKRDVKIKILSKKDLDASLEIGRKESSKRFLKFNTSKMNQCKNYKSYDNCNKEFAKGKSKHCKA